VREDRGMKLEKVLDIRVCGIVDGFLFQVVLLSLVRTVFKHPLDTLNRAAGGSLMERSISTTFTNVDIASTIRDQKLHNIETALSGSIMEWDKLIFGLLNRAGLAIIDKVLEHLKLTPIRGLVNGGKTPVVLEREVSSRVFEECEDTEVTTSSGIMRRSELVVVHEIEIGLGIDQGLCNVVTTPVGSKMQGSVSVMIFLVYINLLLIDKVVDKLNSARHTSGMVQDGATSVIQVVIGVQTPIDDGLGLLEITVQASSQEFSFGIRHCSAETRGIL
jgi:hypothetical protein